MRIQVRAGVALWLGILGMGVELPVSAGWGGESPRAALRLQLDEAGDGKLIFTVDADALPEEPDEDLLIDAVADALDCPVDRVESRIAARHWEWRARCEHVFARRDLELAGDIDPTPLLPPLQHLRIPWLLLDIVHPRAGFSVCRHGRPLPARKQSNIRYASWVPVATGGPPLHVAFGYRPADAGYAAGVLLGLLLVPIAVTLRLRAIALREATADPAATWFRFARWYRWIGVGTIVFWNAAASLLHAQAMVSLGLVHLAGEVGGSLAVFLVPVPVLLLCDYLAHPVSVRLRDVEWTRGEAMRHAVWTLAALLVPLILLVVGVHVMAKDLRLGVLLLTVAYFSRMLLVQGWQRVTRQAPQALTHGELRDHIGELAAEAGVRLGPISVLPTTKGRLANAFALHGNRMLLTDHLVHTLSRRELDAVVGHELAHLKRGDPRRLWITLFGLIFVTSLIGGFLPALPAFRRWEEITPIVFPLFGVVVMISLFYVVRRRVERATDKTGLALTGDPEALITGLARLTHANAMPLEWGKWDERLLTHPSTLRRVQAIARESRVSEERLQELLLAAAGPAPEAERYPLPPLFDGERVFSTSFKNNAAFRLRWALNAAMVLPPALAAFAAQREGWEAPWTWAASLIGAVAALALTALVMDRGAGRDDGALERRLRARLEAEGLSIRVAGGLFVGLAPDAAPRLYEWRFDWDAGFLFLQGDQMSYVGEQARFTLTPQQVTGLSLGPGAPGWTPTERVVVVWQDEEGGRSGTFSLRPAWVRSRRQLSREAPALVKRLQGWWQAPPPAVFPATPIGAGLPPTGAVTSTAPRSMASARTLLFALVRILFVAFVVGVLLGLYLYPLECGLASLFVTAAAAALFHWLPYRRLR
jgi:heat shock protein HtpX